MIWWFVIIKVLKLYPSTKVNIFCLKKKKERSYEIRSFDLLFASLGKIEGFIIGWKEIHIQCSAEEAYNLTLKYKSPTTNKTLLLPL